MGQFYAIVERLLENVDTLAATTDQLKLDNAALRVELKQTREWLFQLNETVAEQGLALQSFKSPPPPQTFDKDLDLQCP